MKVILTFLISSILSGIGLSRITDKAVFIPGMSIEKNGEYAFNRIFLRHDGGQLLLALLHENSVFSLDTNLNIVDKNSIAPGATCFNTNQEGEWFLLFPERAYIAVYEKSGFVNYLPTVSEANFHNRVITLNSDVFLLDSGGDYLPIKQNMLVYHPFLQSEFKQDSLVISTNEETRVVFKNNSIICAYFTGEDRHRWSLSKDTVSLLTVLPDGRIIVLIGEGGGYSNILVLSPYERSYLEIGLKSDDPFIYNHVAVSPEGVIYYLYKDGKTLFVKRRRIVGEFVRF